MYEQIIGRIKKSVLVNDQGCWIWQRRIDTSGYGQMRSKDAPSRTPLAHRISYEVFVRPIPAGLQIDHLCRVTACVNPKHLEPVTPQENVRRSVPRNSAKSECKYGHPFTEANTRTDAHGYRYCRECNRQRCREFKIRRAQKARQAQ